MTDAEALRAAAKILRERAEQAPTGPWWADLSPDYGTIVAHAAHPDDRELGGSCLAFFAYPDDSERRTYIGAFDSAAYIALMSPLLAEPLAAALEYAAEVDEKVRERGYQTVAWVPRMVEVARVLLGGAS